MRPDITPGGTFPDYELPDQDRVTRTLSEIQGEDPLILTLARGNYCPKEHQQHLELAAKLPEDRRVLYQGRHDIDRHPPLKPGVPRVGRRPVAVPRRIRVGSSRRTSTSRSTPTPSTTR